MTSAFYLKQLPLLDLQERYQHLGGLRQAVSFHFQGEISCNSKNPWLDLVRPVSARLVGRRHIQSVSQLESGG